MKSLLPILLLCLFFLGACQEKAANEVKVVGQIGQLAEGTIYVTHLNESGIKQLDTIRTNAKGTFKFNLCIANDITPITLFFVEQKKWTTLFAEPGDEISIRGNILYVDLLSIQGGTVNNDLDRFKQSIRLLYKKRLDLLAMKNTQDNALQIELAEINLKLKSKAKEFVRENPSSIASVVLIRDFFYQDYDPVTIELLSLLKGSAKWNKTTLRLKEGIKNWN